MSGVAIRGIQEHCASANEALQVGVLRECRAEAHVAAVHVAVAPAWQLEQELYGSRAMIGVHQSHLHTWGSKRTCSITKFT